MMGIGKRILVKIGDRSDGCNELRLHKHSMTLR